MKKYKIKIDSNKALFFLLINRLIVNASNIDN